MPMSWEPQQTTSISVPTPTGVVNSVLNANTTLLAWTTRVKKFMQRRCNYFKKMNGCSVNPNSTAKLRSENGITKNAAQTAATKLSLHVKRTPATFIRIWSVSSSSVHQPTAVQNIPNVWTYDSKEYSDCRIRKWERYSISEGRWNYVRN